MKRLGRERAMVRLGVWAATAAALALAATPALSREALTLKDGEKVVTLAPDELHSLPQETLTIDDHGQNHTYTGAQLGAVLDKLGAPHGAALKGEALGYIVVATAGDGYRVALSLSEVDPLLGDRHVIVADTEGGKPLDPREGPLRLVVAGDQRQARSERNLVSLELKR